MSDKSPLSFAPVELADIERVYPYTASYGEGSCQHSPVSMWSNCEKYGDKVCIRDGFLFTLRENLCDETYRVYLAPMGDGDLKAAYELIMEDAASYGRKVRFKTMTEKASGYLKENFPGKFEHVYDRDLSEYIFGAQIMLEFPGKEHARRRTEIRSYWRDFGDHTEVNVITPNDLEEVQAYAYEWLKENAETHDEAALEREMSVIRKQIAHYDELGLTGTVIRVHGDVRAFCYGIPLNDDYYDVLIEKGDRAYPGIYRVLRQESTKLNVSGYSYINFEEDVGVPGLRRLKESYCPIFMIDKYVVTQL